MTNAHCAAFTNAIQWRDTDQHGLCRPSSLLAFFQESALEVSQSLGLTPQYLEGTYGGFWMLTRVRYTLTEPIFWQDRITLHTSHRPPKAMLFYRDYELRKDGRKIGTALALWGLANLESRRLLDLSRIQALTDASVESTYKQTALRRNLLPNGLLPLGKHLVRYSQTDRNGHLNNCKYADLICDNIPSLAAEGGAYLSALQLNYSAECRPGCTLALYGKREQSTCFFRGLTETGSLCFDAAATLAFPTEKPVSPSPLR